MNLSRIVLLAGIASTNAQAGLLGLWKLDSSPADSLADFPATWGGNAAYSNAVVAPASSAAGEFDGSRWLSSASSPGFERNRAFSACAWIKGGPQDSYQFGFNSPPQGDVRFAWAPDHGITGTNGLAALPAEWTALHLPTLPPGQVVISEFLARNVGGLEDEDHDSSDWIELFNPGAADVDLAGWGLTDDPMRPQQWRLPSIVLRPGEYRIVFASGKDRSGAGGNLHTNFKLSQNGGYLALSDPSGALFHVYDAYPQQEGNIAFGLLSTGKPSDGRNAWRYLPPTPAAAPAAAAFSAAMIGQVGSSPILPGPGQEMIITLRPSPEATLTATPELYYRIAQTAEKKLDFHDDGLHGDGAAGDSLWAAVIPASTAGQLIRWRLSMNSSPAGESCWPVIKPSFASTIASPNYEGTVVSGGTGSDLMPVYQLFGSSDTFDSSSGGRGTFFAEGRCYDNVLIRAKGTTTLRLAKASHRIDFNPGREFVGTGGHPPQGELNLNAEYIDPSYLRQNLQLWMHRDSGNAGAPHFPVKLTLNNAHWKLAFHTYSADRELLEVLGLDPRGALYKQVFTLSSTTGEKKTRRWEDKSDLAQLAAGISGNSDSEARSRFIHDHLHLPSVINYLAVARIAQEGDDVWANMTVYRDSEGTREWRPIPFDLNLSFGQLYFGDSPSTNNFIQADRDNNKSHPLYGSGACCPTYRSGTYNQLYDAIIRTPDTRAMLLRRIRTLMDRYLTTSAATSPLEARFDSMGALISAEAVNDRSRWGWPVVTVYGPYGLGSGISPAQGLATLKSSFLEVRRTHLYVTHSIHNPSRPIGLGNYHNAGIPDSQINDPVIHFGTIETQPISGNQNEEFVELVNPGADAVDVSDWTLAGRFKFAAGTVIPAGSSLFVSPDVVAFRSRSVSPSANENRCVVGPFSGHLSAYGGSLSLENADGKLIARVALPVAPLAPPVSLTVTEILSSSRHDGTAANGDWWELTNNAVAPLDLTGFSWDDDRSMPFQAIFPQFTLGAGESAIILDEDDDAAFRAVWNLPASVKILTRADFGLSSFRGLGYGDSIIIYQPDGSQSSRADYPTHSSGKSRAWLRSGAPVPGGFSEAGRFSAIASNGTPGDVASPGSAAADPAALATAYGTWTSKLDLWAESADPDADPDRDGRTNRAEYVFGGSPRTADDLPPQTIRMASGNLEWTFVRRSNDATIGFSLESSQDVSHWNPVNLPLLRTSPHPVMGDYEHATFSIPLVGNCRFFRARAD